MRGVNRAVVMGWVGADPQVHTTAGGKRVARISVATHEYWTDRETGERRKHTDWHRVVAFDGRARLVEAHLTKGDAVSFVGRMKTRRWRDETQGVDRWTTEVVADEVDLIGRPARAPVGAPGGQAPPEDPVPETFDDDLPF